MKHYQKFPFDGYVYIIHFESRYCHAQHYIGFSYGNKKNAYKRLVNHKKGKGANLLKHVNKAGIDYTISRLIKGNKLRERAIKKSGSGCRYCPVCKGKIKFIDLK
jgi:predicted GIY-YIG superfamily endonuclease